MYMINFKSNQARFMCQLKKTIQIVTYCGLIPFYTPRLLDLLKSIYSFQFIEISDGFSYLYCVAIIAFLSGMQWQKIITEGKEKLILLPIFPFFLGLLYSSDFLFLNPSIILIIALTLSLLIDLFILEKGYSSWFKNLRINATFLACISFFL